MIDFGNVTRGIAGVYSLCWRGAEPFGRFHLTGPLPGSARPSACPIGVTDCKIRLEGHAFSKTNHVRLAEADWLENNPVSAFQDLRHRLYSLGALQEASIVPGLYKLYWGQTPTHQNVPAGPLVVQGPQLKSLVAVDGDTGYSCTLGADCIIRLTGYAFQHKNRLKILDYTRLEPISVNLNSTNDSSSAVFVWFEQNNPSPSNEGNIVANDSDANVSSNASVNTTTPFPPGTVADLTNAQIETIKANYLGFGENPAHPSLLSLQTEEFFFGRPLANASLSYRAYWHIDTTTNVNAKMLDKDVRYQWVTAGTFQILGPVVPENTIAKLARDYGLDRGLFFDYEEAGEAAAPVFADHTTTNSTLNNSNSSTTTSMLASLLLDEDVNITDVVVDASGVPATTTTTTTTHFEYHSCVIGTPCAIAVEFVGTDFPHNANYFAMLERCRFNDTGLIRAGGSKPDSAPPAALGDAGVGVPAPYRRRLSGQEETGIPPAPRRRLIHNTPTTTPPPLPNPLGISAVSRFRDYPARLARMAEVQPHRYFVPETGYISFVPADSVFFPRGPAYDASYVRGTGWTALAPPNTVSPQTQFLIMEGFVNPAATAPVDTTTERSASGGGQDLLRELTSRANMIMVGGGVGNSTSTSSSSSAITDHAEIIASAFLLDEATGDYYLSKESPATGNSYSASSSFATDLLLNSLEVLPNAVMVENLANKTVFRADFGLATTLPSGSDYEMCWSGNEVLLSAVKLHGPIDENLRVRNECPLLNTTCSFFLAGDFFPVEAPVPEDVVLGDVEENNDTNGTNATAVAASSSFSAGNNGSTNTTSAGSSLRNFIRIVDDYVCDSTKILYESNVVKGGNNTESEISGEITLPNFDKFHRADNYTTCWKWSNLTTDPWIRAGYTEFTNDYHCLLGEVCFLSVENFVRPVVEGFIHSVIVMQELSDGSAGGVGTNGTTSNSIEGGNASSNSTEGSTSPTNGTENATYSVIQLRFRFSADLTCNFDGTSGGDTDTNDPIKPYFPNLAPISNASWVAGLPLFPGLFGLCLDVGLLPEVDAASFDSEKNGSLRVLQRPAADQNWTILNATNPVPDWMRGSFADQGFRLQVVEGEMSEYLVNVTTGLSAYVVVDGPGANARSTPGGSGVAGSSSGGGRQPLLSWYADSGRFDYFARDTADLIPWLGSRSVDYAMDPLQIPNAVEAPLMEVEFVLDSDTYLAFPNSTAAEGRPAYADLIASSVGGSFPTADPRPVTAGLDVIQGMTTAVNIWKNASTLLENPLFRYNVSDPYGVNSSLDSLFGWGRAD